MNENPVSEKDLFDVPLVWDPLSVGTTNGVSLVLTYFLENGCRTTTQDHSVPELDRKSDQSQVQNLGQETPKKAGHVKQENKTGDPKNSAKMYTVKDSNLRSEDEFIKSMGNETSEWAQVSKGKSLTAWARKHWIWSFILTDLILKH
jgi:hypothetical protein